MTHVRTRFAPSPTGSLHVGNARTAVLNWLIARHHDGEFILRIEDTDAERNVAGAEAELLRDLEWLGLEWDEGPLTEGPERGDHGPYHQSRRGEIYRRYADQLLEAGAAYRCFCSPETLDAERRRARAEGRSPRYSGNCRDLEAGDAAERAAAGEPHVLRFATPAAGDIGVDDVIRGQVTVDAGTLGDFVLVRSDGVPTYNFAAVVDDSEMGISHVIRGVGHLSNTPQQVLIYAALGQPVPIFAHTPTVLGEDRTKLSKRSGARPLATLREEGFHPDAVLNYLSLLGWSSPSGDEVLSRDRLIDEVSLDRINAGDVVFDPDKMRWLSGQHIARMSADELAEAVRSRVVDSRFTGLMDEGFPAVLEAVRSHLTTFGEITDHLAPFLGPEGESFVPDATEAGVLRAVRAAVAECEEWTEEAIGEAVRSGGKAAGARGSNLYAPVRRAVTGQEHGPPLTAVLAVQGRERSLEHLDAALARASSAV